MTELAVKQLSPEWFRIRRDTPLTASQFADAIGLGQGKPYDFLASLLNDNDNNTNSCLQHGLSQEPLIDEAYQLLTSTETTSTGLWIPSTDSPLHSLVAASPDRKITTRDGKTVGLCEYKAPVHCLYSAGKHPHGIPRKYMAQIQGQMAVCGATWCDFMAVCTKTKEIRLKRVMFCASYWRGVEAKLKRFIAVLQQAKQRQHQGLPHCLDFPEAQQLRSEPMTLHLLPGEKDIVVVDKLQKDQWNRYRCDSYPGQKNGPWVHYDVLMGDVMIQDSVISEEALQRLDREIALKVR